MDHRAIDTEMVYVHEHLLMPTDDPGLWWLVSKLRQPSFTSHRKWLARESLWIQLPPWTVLLPQKSPFGGEQRCDHHRPLVEEHSGRHQPWKAGALVWIQCQTCVICWRLTLGFEQWSCYGPSWMSQIWKWSVCNDSIGTAPSLWQLNPCTSHCLIAARLV